MKCIFTAAAILFSGMLMALTPEDLKGLEKPDWVHSLSEISVDEAYAQINECVEAANKLGDVSWLAVAAGAYGVTYYRENKEASWQNCVDKMKEKVTEYKGDPKDSYFLSLQYAMVKSWYSGIRNDPRIAQAIEYGTKNIDSLERGQMVELAEVMKKENSDKNLIIEILKKANSPKTLCKLYSEWNMKEEMSVSFYEAAFQGKLKPEEMNQFFPEVLNYEMSKSDFDANTLRSKLIRLNIIYTAKAHSVENNGENPWSRFLGMLDDNIKILESMK